MPRTTITKGAHSVVALLLPSYRRFKDLFITLWKTPLSSQYRFIVTANYNDLQLAILRRIFSEKAVFIDERPYGKSGMIRAYNIAFDWARQNGYRYAALWADDIMPQKNNWHEEVDELFIKSGHVFGIFSTDECHKKRFGWNFFGGVPNAHFFIADVTVLGNFFLNPALNAYVGDYEVCVRMKDNNVNMILLPVRLDHNHTQNPTRIKNSKYYSIDLRKFNELYPHLAGIMDDVVVKGDYTSGSYVADTGDVLHTRENLPFKSYSDFMKGRI